MMKGELTNRLLKGMLQERREKIRLKKREKLAKAAHEMWSHWMHHLFSKTIKRNNGFLIIPTYLVKQWMRLMNTPYEQLTEEEKQSDREVADKYLM